MTDLRWLLAEERALMTFARLTMDVYAVSHSERSYEIARGALVRAESLRREAERQQQQGQGIEVATPA